MDMSVKPLCCDPRTVQLQYGWPSFCRRVRRRERASWGYFYTVTPAVIYKQEQRQRCLERSSNSCWGGGVFTFHVVIYPNGRGKVFAKESHRKRRDAKFGQSDKSKSVWRSRIHSCGDARLLRRHLLHPAFDGVELESLH